MGGSSSAVTGYKHYLDFHLALGLGEPDNISEVQFDGRRAWAGNHEAGEFTIDAPNLFDGATPEGGVGGAVELLPGSDSQAVNTYLQGMYSKTLIPAFKGICSLIFKNFYLGDHPYFKNPAVRGQWVYKLADGSPQWYPETAGIRANYGAEETVSNLILLGTISSYFAGDGRWGGTFDGDTGELLIHEEHGSYDADDGSGTIRAYHEYRTRHYYLNDSSPAFDQDWPDVESLNSLLDRTATQQHNVFFIANNSTLSMAQAAGNPSHITWLSNASYNDYSLNRPLAPVGSYTLSSGDAAGGGSAFGNSNYFDDQNNIIWAIEAANWDEGEGPVAFNYIGIWSPFSERPIHYLRGDDSQPDLRDNFPSNIVVDQYGYAWGKNGGGYLFEFQIFEGIRINRFFDISTHFDDTGDRWSGMFAIARDSGHEESGGRLLVIDTNLVTIYDLLSGQILESFAHSPSAVTLDVFSQGRYIRIADKMYEFGYSTGSLPPIYNCNAIHCIRELMTDTDLVGKGIPESRLDDTLWRAAADTCFSERNGLAISWQSNGDIDELIADISRHINALPPQLDRTTGLIKPVLIRNDYNVNNLLVLDRTNIIKIEGLEVAGQSKRINTLICKYTNGLTGDEASVTIRNSALINRDGVISETIEYPFFTDESAVWLAGHRDFRALSSTLKSADIYADRTAGRLSPGDVVIINRPDKGFHNSVCRVFQARLGKGGVRLVVTEDVFDVDSVPTIPTVDRYQPVLVSDPVEVSNRSVFELPYYLLVQSQGDANADLILESNPNAGFVAAAAANPGKLLNAQVHIDGTNSGTLDYCPWGEISADLGYTETTVALSNYSRIQDVEVGDYAQIGGEMVVVRSIDTSTAIVELGRCINDSAIEKHLAGAIIYFYKDLVFGNEVEYTSSESISVQLVSNNGSQVADVDEVPADDLVFGSRAIRPYLPGNIQVNSVLIPDFFKGEFVLDWAHRSRLDQTAQTIFDFSSGDIGPEPGTTYNLNIYNGDNSLVRSETNIINSTYEYSTDIELEDLGFVLSDIYQFNADGSFTLSADTEITLLVVGGGGSGGTFGGGGGGGGGVVELTRLLAAGTYNVTVAPTTASTGFRAAGANGASSSVDDGVVTFIEATGGIGGGTGGGGALGGASGTGLIDGVVVNSANPAGADPGSDDGSGGGGAGENDATGAGGSGEYFALIDSYYGGGGGGSKNSSTAFNPGGIGGGGNGSIAAALTTPGADNSGGGGGGAWNSGGYPETAGGSGVVILSAANVIATTGSPVLTPGGVPNELLGSLNNTLRFELFSERDSFESFNRHDVTIDRVGFGRHFGKYFGR